MKKKQSSRLDHLTDEVAHLHPLLKELLPKLPNVENVEYTHGPQEMGADFTLSKFNEVFKTRNYVGVIAKLGKILQDFSDVDRQVEECKISRTFQGGKEKIRIDEVWVIATENISNNAQEKIHEKYKLQNIQFLDGEKLAALIDEYLPIFWTKVPIHIGAYLSDQNQKIKTLDQSMSLVPATDGSIYIEQDIEKYKSANYKLRSKKTKPPEKCDIKSEIESNKLVFVEADFGAGKSKLLRKLFENYTSPEEYLRTKFFPIFCSYKELVEQFDGILQNLISSKVSPEIRKELVSPKYIIFIDGIDEKNLPIEEQRETLKRVVDEINNTSKLSVVMTSRPLKILDETEIFDPDSFRYTICPMTTKKTIEFLKTLCSKLNITQRILEDLKKSQLLKELPRNPIAAILLAKLLNENPSDLPGNMTDLYAKYIELTLGRWDLEKGIQTQKEYEILDNVLVEISKFVIENEMTSISRGDVLGIFNDYLSSRHFNINVNELFEKMLDRCEIMSTDPSGDILIFKHRSFAEFLCAKALLKKQLLTLDNRVFQLYWMNVYFFAIGQMKDCPEALKAIMELNPNSPPERWLKFINMANYLLAAYSTPYATISEGIENIMVEAAKLYLDIAEGKLETPLGDISKMTLLFIFQYLIRTHYSYEFFKDALEECALRIEDGSYDENIKMYALFFLNVTYIELGEKENFDFLLKAHFGELPLDLMLAIECESKTFTKRNELIKKQDKYVKRMFKGNPGFRFKIEEIFKKPIKLLSQKTK